MTRSRDVIESEMEFLFYAAMRYQNAEELALRMLEQLSERIWLDDLMELRVRFKDYLQKKSITELLEMAAGLPETFGTLKPGRRYFRTTDQRAREVAKLPLRQLRDSAQIHLMEDFSRRMDVFLDHDRLQRQAMRAAPALPEAPAPGTDRRDGPPISVLSAGLDSVHSSPVIRTGATTY